MIVASMLPTPPSSPAPLSCKPLQPVKESQDLSPSRLTPIISATLSANTILTPRTSPAKSAAASGSTPLRTVAELKSVLRIIGWRCGAQTLKKTECRSWILIANRQLIDSQLRLMAGLTRVSQDFEPALLKLVMLVHCNHHNAGQPKKCRLQAWRLAFPPATADGSEPGVPLEQRIRKALGPWSAECIAGDGRTCERKVGGQKVQNCKKTLQELVKQDVYSDDAKLQFLLKVLEWNRTCSDHESSRQFTWVTEWKRSVISELPLPEPVIDRAIANNAPKEPQTPPSAQVILPLVTAAPAILEHKGPQTVHIHGLSTPRASPGRTTNLEIDPASHWPKAYDTSPFDIHAPANSLVSSTHSHKLISTGISRPLDPQDLHPGYVYAYEVEGNIGYIKIGYTMRSVTDRLEQWSFNCNRQTKRLYPPLLPSSPPSPPPPAAAHEVSNAATAPTTDILVPHARRVEALCHAELHHRRIRMYCDACLKQHIEWFNVSSAEVTAVIRKWSRWMATCPYEPLQLRSEPKWRLKASEVRRVSKIEQFMRELVVEPASLGREGDII
jgi:hypothetical protein